jgi:hypothetical protein
MDECDIIDALTDVGKKIAHQLAALTIRTKSPSRFDNPSGVAMPTAPESLDFHRLIVATLHLRLVIEGIDMAWPTIHEEEDHALGLRSKVGLRQFPFQLGGQATFRKKPITLQESGQGRPCKPSASLP